MNYTNVTTGTSSSSSGVINAPKKERETQAASYVSAFPKESFLFERSLSQDIASIQNSFEKTSEFYSANKSTIDNDSIHEFMAGHEEVYAAFAKAHHEVESLTIQDTDGKDALSAVGVAHSLIEKHVDTLITVFKEQEKVVPSPNSGSSPRVPMANLNVFMVISLASADMYQMATALSELQGKITARLNEIMSALSDLQSIIQVVNKNYQDLAAYVAQNGGTLDKNGNRAPMAMPTNINWGSDLGLGELKWNQLGGGGNNSVFVFSSINGSDVSNNKLLKLFGTHFDNNFSGVGKHSGYIMTMDNVQSAIKSVSDMLDGILPTDQGSYYSQYGNSVRSSALTGSFLTQIGKTTEMIQSKISAAANTVNLSQQSAFQVLGAWTQCLTVWGNISRN